MASVKIVSAKFCASKIWYERCSKHYATGRSTYHTCSIDPRTHVIMYIDIPSYWVGICIMASSSGKFIGILAAYGRELKSYHPSSAHRIKKFQQSKRLVRHKFFIHKSCGADKLQ